MKRALAGAAVLGTALLAAPGCEGGEGAAPAAIAPSADAGTEPDAGGEPGEPSDWVPGANGDPNSAGYMPIRRLNRREYAFAVQDLLQADSDVFASLPSDTSGASGFSSAGLVSDSTVNAFARVAEELAAAADPEALAGCDVGLDGDAECARRLVTSFGERAYRRPLSESEIDEYLAFFDDELRGAQELDAVAALRTLLEAILQAPGFLYHWELGPRPATADELGVVPLGAHEIAARLSFFLWSSIPDDALFAAADANELSTPEQVAAQARRMLEDPRAARSIESFHLEWLEISLDGAVKSPELYPSFDSELAASMEAELSRFAVDLIQRSGTLGDLFTSRQAFVNDRLAPVYGLDGLFGGPLQRATLNAAERPGLFTRAGFLTSTANAYEGNPTRRGAVFRRRVLCDELTPPPANVPPLPPPSAGLSARERHAAHVESPACQGCHLLTDPIGFGLSSYDAIGRFQTLDAGEPVDAAGTVFDLDGADPAFDGAPALMQLLAESRDVKACVTRQWLRFAFQRAESAADDGSLAFAYRAFEESGFELAELLVAVTQSRSFRFRTPAEGEILK